MMKKRVCYKFTALLLALGLLVTGCESGEKNDSSGRNSSGKNSIFSTDSDQSEEERFEQFSKDMFMEDIAENTIDLHYAIAYPENFGIQDYEVNIGTYSTTDKEDSEKELEELSETLDSFSRNKLNKEQQIAFDILQDYVKTEKDAEDLYYYGEVFSAMTGYHTQLPVLLAEYTFRTERDVTDYLEILSQIDESFSSYIVYEEEKAEAGLGVPDFALDDAIEVCTEFVKNPKNCYLIETFDERLDALDGISEDKKKEYKEQNKELVLNDVMDAYHHLTDALKGLKGRGKNEGGLCNFPEGKRFYEYLIRSNVGSDMDVDEIKKVTEDFMESRLDKVWEMLYDDDDLYDLIMEKDNLTDMEPDEIMPDLIKKCEKDFPNIPDVKYEIKYVPKAMEEHLNPAFYLTPPIDDAEHNVIYINRKYEDREDMYPLLAHEGYPGHLYQIVSSTEYERPLVRHLFSFSGYTEGYATYAEMYSYTLADAPKDFARILQYDNSITLALSAYIDICVNYYGWSVDDVEECLSDYGMGNADTAKSVYEMVVEEPAEYLEYFVGYLEFMSLRNEAKEKLGDKFVLKDFHEFIISVGPVPFYLLEDYMYDWIKEQE